jgi:hypothetical protein
MEGTQESKSKNEETLTTSSEILGYPGHPIVGQTNVTDGDDLAFMLPCLTDRSGQQKWHSLLKVGAQ